jgi:biotin carboxyl carrier protein
MTAPIPGVVLKVSVLPGQKVERGDELLTIEAMKMFNVMRSPSSGTIATVHIKDGDRVVQGQPLVTFAP